MNASLARRLGLCCGLLALSAPLQAAPRTINYSSNFSGINFLSDGTRLEASPDAFIFSLGASTVPLNPDLSNLQEWAAGWRSLDTTVYNKEDFQFIDTAVLADNSVFAPGEQAYIWGYNKTVIEPDTEWVVVADPAWKFGQVDDVPREDDWTVGSAPQEAARMGAINAADGSYHMLFANAYMVVVPEPGTASLLMVGALGLLRRRRAA